MRPPETLPLAFHVAAFPAGPIKNGSVFLTILSSEDMPGFEQTIRFSDTNGGLIKLYNLYLDLKAGLNEAIPGLTMPEPDDAVAADAMRFHHEATETRRRELANV